MTIRCAKCKKDLDEVYFQQTGWFLDRVTPRFHSYCNPCRRKINKKRYADPEYRAISQAKRRQRYRETGR